MSDRKALFWGVIFMVTGVFLVFWVLPRAITGLVTGEGWGIVLSGVVVVGILLLISTFDYGKAVLAFFFITGGIGGIFISFDSENSLLIFVIGLVSIVLGAWLALRIKEGDRHGR